MILNIYIHSINTLSVATYMTHSPSLPPHGVFKKEDKQIKAALFQFISVTHVKIIFTVIITFTFCLTFEIF